MAISGAYAIGDEIVMQDAKVEVDLTPITSSSFADISTWGGEVAVSGGDVPTSQFFTFGVNGPIVLPGNRNSWTVVCTVLYTEDATDPFTEIYAKFADPAAHSDGYDFDAQWSPKGGANPDLLFTTSGGKLIGCTVPMGTAEGTDPTTFTFTVECRSIVQSTVPV